MSLGVDIRKLITLPGYVKRSVSAGTEIIMLSFNEI